MRTHSVMGGGGTRLHIVETGQTQGRSILFIHGFSQCGLAWSRQMDSTLAESHRLIAVDMRGHGLSDKPVDAYDDPELWAYDVHAVMQGLRLERPVLCCWSYGPFVLDYLRHFGDDAISGLVLVSALSKLGSDEAIAVLAPEFLHLVPGFFSTDVTESVQSLTSLLRMCFAEQLSAPDLYRMLGYNISVPPAVRQALLSRIVDNDEVLGAIRKPVLLVHATDDAIVDTAVVDQHRARIPHAQVEMMTRASHAPFWVDAPAFNARLQTFVASAWTGAARAAGAGRHAS